MPDDERFQKFAHYRVETCRMCFHKICGLEDSLGLSMVASHITDSLMLTSVHLSQTFTYLSRHYCEHRRPRSHCFGVNLAPLAVTSSSRTTKRQHFCDECILTTAWNIYPQNSPWSAHHTSFVRKNLHHDSVDRRHKQLECFISCIVT